MGEDQKCQVPISANKNCQDENIKQSVNPKNDMQSEKPAIEVKKPDQPTYKKVSKNKNCSNNNIVNM